MAMDRSFVELNRTSTQRIRAMAEKLSDEEMQTRVGEHWTAAIVMAHLAFWDRRVLHAMDLTEREGRFSPVEIDIRANDISLPLWAAIPPRVASRLAIETAEECDRRLEALDPALLEEMFNYNKRWVIRALHRNEHLDEADSALGTKPDHR